MNEAHVSLVNISRRLKLSCTTLAKLRKVGSPDVKVLTKTSSRGARFHRFHDRAVALLREMLDEAKHPLTLREMQAELATKCRLSVSRSSLSRFLRERLDATFRLVKPITQLQNMKPAVMQRQYAAARYIEALASGYRVISIDESVMKWSDHRKRGWVPNHRRN
jgi:hypothetical protein